MTEDQLIEKMAEAMCGLLCDAPEHIREEFRLYARAALSVVRENEKQGSVHAQSTGAERSSDLSAEEVMVGALNPQRTHILVSVRNPVLTSQHPKPTFTQIAFTLEGAKALMEKIKDFFPREVPAQAETGPTDDRSAPAAPREPDLPSSLLSPRDHQGGLTKGKRS